MRAELIISDAIKAGRCPFCGGDMRDKGSYMRCTACNFQVVSGTWDEVNGYCLRYAGCDPWTAHTALEDALEIAAERHMDLDYFREGVTP